MPWQIPLPINREEMREAIEGKHWEINYIYGNVDKNIAKTNVVATIMKKNSNRTILTSSHFIIKA